MNAQEFLEKKAAPVNVIRGGANAYGRRVGVATKEPSFSVGRVLKGVRNGVFLGGAGTAAYASSN